jgi:hypothetical protein
MIPLLLLATTLVLRSGDRISVAGAITKNAGRVVFRSIDGTLYSLAASEVESIDTQAPAPAPPPEKKKLKLPAEERERLLRELENNHEGVAAPVEQTRSRPLPPAKDQSQEEWQWRRESRAHEEAVRRSKENLDLLLERVERLQGEIRGLLGLGYKPRQFTLQTTQLQDTLDQIPYAQLEVTRAERELAQFRDDARKRGIMPGWLR